MRKGGEKIEGDESNSTMASTCFGHRNPFFFSLFLSLSLSLAALSATCRGDVRQKRASVAYNERGTPLCF